jgi:epoxyqueuosine reductase QueG
VNSTARDVAARILAVTEAEDVPVLGMGSSAALGHEPPGYRPEDLLPGARSMVCFALPVPRGVYATPAHATETIWRSQNLYYRRLDSLSLRMAQLLEADGVQAVPVFGCCPMAVNRRGQVAGYLNLIRMGQLTGIGTIGRNGLLVHSRYGSRLMLGGLVTTAELPALRIPEGCGPGCPADCRLCVAICPVQAISPKGRRVNVMRCLSYTARTPLMSHLRFGILTRTNQEAAARLMNQRAFDEHTMQVCSRCILHCPLGEQAGSERAQPGRGATEAVTAAARRKRS